MDINTVQVPAECTLINERKQERRRRRRASSYDFNSAVWKNRKKETPVAFIVAVHGNPLSRFREHPARARFFSPRDAAIIIQERWEQFDEKSSRYLRTSNREKNREIPI